MRPARSMVTGSLKRDSFELINSDRNYRTHYKQLVFDFKEDFKNWRYDLYKTGYEVDRRFRVEFFGFAFFLMKNKSGSNDEIVV